MRLEPLQRTMFEAVAGEGSLEATAGEVKGGALTREDRVGIYAEMYWLRMRDALAADYPQVRRVVGEETFDVLVARHLRQRPSHHYSLGRLGADFAQTVRDSGDEVPRWLADLAALEWARAEAFVAVDAPVLEPSALAALTAQTFSESRLVASPSLRLLEPKWNVAPLWAALDADEPWAELPIEPATSPLVVWRQGFQVFHVAISTAEARALSLVQQQLRLPAVCAAFVDAPEPVQAAFLAIGSWAAEGMLSELALDAA